MVKEEIIKIQYKHCCFYPRLHNSRIAAWSVVWMMRLYINSLDLEDRDDLMCRLGCELAILLVN